MTRPAEMVFAEAHLVRRRGRGGERCQRRAQRCRSGAATARRRSWRHRGRRRRVGAARRGGTGATRRSRRSSLPSPSPRQGTETVAESYVALQGVSRGRVVRGVAEEALPGGVGDRHRDPVGLGAVPEPVEAPLKVFDPDAAVGPRGEDEELLVVLDPAADGLVGRPAEREAVTGGVGEGGPS